MKIHNSFLALFIPCILFAQSLSTQTPKFKIGLEIGHFSPDKRTFAENYEQTINGFPISVIGITSHYLYSSKLNFSFEVFLIHNVLTNEHKVKFDILPIYLGFKYYFVEKKVKKINTKFFIEAKPAYFINLFSIKKLSVFDEYGNISYVDIGQTYYGPGFNFSLGVEIPVLQTVDVGLKIRYDYNQIGEIAKGGLGNTGGFIFSLSVLKTLF